MSRFKKIVDAPVGSKFILQGNEAFALGVIHAGFHTADGYPGTPSTEVIDKSLAHVQDRIQVGWSVNEAVATAVGIGHSLAGHDSVVTMKIPGVFQAGDPITTSAFYTAEAGAFVIYAATDYVPSSTQHVIDARYFFASSRVPVLEPRDHQEMYEIAWAAADISRKFNTQVVVLASGILSHSEGLVTTREPRTVEPRQLKKNLHDWMLMPAIARANYNKATTQRIPNIMEWSETSTLISETEGSDDFGIILVGESDIIVREALESAGLNPSILSMSIANPIPEHRIRAFADKIKGALFVFEDGDTFLQDKIKLMDIQVTGKEPMSTITDWKPEMVLEVLSRHMEIKVETKKNQIDITPVMRPPSICPGCPYKAFALTVDRLKKKGKLYAAFGEIGCSTLLYFYNAIDTVLCMGGSDSMRQGFTLSRPDMVHKTISVIGDSCECHSGLDATRNAVFRNAAGVKVVLDNRITAMTGGQPAPTSETNLAGVPNKFVLEEVLAAEKCNVLLADSYDIKAVEKVLTEALELAEKGVFSTVVLKGPCIQETERRKRVRQLQFNYDKCKKCGLCNMCPGIEQLDDKTPQYTNLCANCGSNNQVCKQRCPFEAIEIIPKDAGRKQAPPQLPEVDAIEDITLAAEDLPSSLRVAIRGIGGQGNLFFGKVLSEMALYTPYADAHIVKGDTHGMAQLGGSVISTFSCGQVYSPLLAPGSVDVLVVMEISEVLRDGFLELLKPGGKIILNNFKALPGTAKKEDYPDVTEIEKALADYNVVKVDANRIVYDLGDTVGRTANVAVLGLLSTIEPFSRIPEEVWLKALMSVSPGAAIKSANFQSFKAGKECK
ncbi:MAG: pyruvate ferredoxin oxidoreductase [bacterium]|nr:pyruvate ferredoxin oxidoreductase [bacterium]